MNKAKKLEETMKTRTAAPTEKYETKSHTESIPDFTQNTKKDSAAEVTALPLLPPDNDSIKILDLSLFDDMEMERTEEEALVFTDLKAFIESSPVIESYYMDITEEGDDDREPRANIIHNKVNGEEIVISKVPYYHLAKTHNLDDENDGCILIAYRDENTRQLTLLMSDVAETQRLTRIMANKGVLITKGAENRNYIYDQNLECKETRLLVNTIGFRLIGKNLCFTYPVGESIGAPVYYSQGDSELNHALCINGDSKEWIHNVILPLNLSNESPSIPFLLFASLMPLFSTLVPGFQGILINIVPDETEKLTSSTGKTTLQKAMLSMQGSPEWMVSWNMTANAIEAKLHDGIGAYLDDLSTSSIGNMEKVVYDNANGTQRGRLNQDGTAKAIKRRNSVIFSSGEAQALDIDKVKDGALVRAIDIAIKASDFGSDDINHTKKVADTIVATVRQNYGFIYRITISMIIERQAYIFEQIARYKSHFIAMSEDVLTKRLALTYAIIATCGDLMIIAIQKLSGDPSMLSRLDPLHITAAMFRKVIGTLNQKSDKHLMVLDTIKQSVILDDDGTTILNHHKTSIGIVDNDIWYIKSTEVNQTISEMDNIVAKRFFGWAKDIGYLHKTDNEVGRFTKTRKINGNAVKTYAFNFDVKIDGNTGNGGNE